MRVRFRDLRIGVAVLVYLNLLSTPADVKPIDMIS